MQQQPPPSEQAAVKMEQAQSKLDELKKKRKQAKDPALINAYKLIATETQLGIRGKYADSQSLRAAAEKTAAKIETKKE